MSHSSLLPRTCYTTLHRAGYSPDVCGINIAEILKLYKCRAITPDINPYLSGDS